MNGRLSPPVAAIRSSVISSGAAAGSEASELLSVAGADVSEEADVSEDDVSALPPPHATSASDAVAIAATTQPSPRLACLMLVPSPALGKCCPGVP